MIVYSNGPEAVSVEDGSKTTCIFTAHTQELLSLSAVGHLAALTFNANGLRALLAILPLIFQTAQRPEPAPFTSSHNPASLTFGAFLTLHFPPSTLFFYSFPLTVPAPNPFLSPIQSVLYDHPLFFVFNKEVVIQAPDSNWVSTYYQHGWCRPL